MPATLLLADDSVTIQRVIELTFADEDVTVVAVGDGDAAIARLNSSPADIVLADVDMPGSDGYAVAAFVHRTPALSHIPVLLLTGAFDPVDEARARDAGCAGVLVKPFEPQMVISRVRELLEHRAPAGEGAAASKAKPSPTAADALLAAPPPPAAPVRQSVDDYFQRLDEAFAHLNVPPPPGAQPIDGHAIAPRDAADAQPAASIPPGATSIAPAPTDTSSPPAAVQHETASAGATPAETLAGSLSMADAFGALLGIERGEAAPVLPDAWLPVPSEEVVEQIARRVSEEVTERVVRQLAPDIVSRVAERLVREELERLKGLQS
jgi:CheY-like chemotaxis protein